MARARPQVNNAIYDELGELWFTARDNPVALLRAEGAVKSPWVTDRLRKHSSSPSLQCLDIGCGAGFLARHLAAAGHSVTGLDLSLPTLRLAKGREIGDSVPTGHGRDDSSGHALRGGSPPPSYQPNYVRGGAYTLPFSDGCFDAVCAMDFLEHVEDFSKVVGEAARVLRPGGLFFFHTFNRNFLSWLFAIKGLEWFVRHTPRHLHVLRLFIKPRELAKSCEAHGLAPLEWAGLRPELGGSAFWRMLATGLVPEDFSFRLTPSLTLAYLGMAVKTDWPAQKARS